MSQHPILNTEGMLFYGRIMAGQLFLFNTDKFKRYIRRQKEGLIVVDVRKEKKIRSLNQNAYYFGVVCKILADEFGYFPQEMHEALKYQFLGVKDEKGLVVPRSTTSLSTAEFEDYLRRIRLWAASEHIITIPLPDNPDAWNVSNNKL